MAQEIVFPKQLAFGVFFLNLFGNRTYSETLEKYLETLPPNTIGNEIITTLKKHGHRLVAGYETHDLKHILLGYEMEADDEMLMQAFMVGNNFTFLNTFISLFFVIWTPNVWCKLKYHYLIGKLTKCIGHWKIEDVAHLSIDEVRKQIGLKQAQITVERFHKISKKHQAPSGFKFNITSFFIFISLLFIEVLIAVFVNDSFIRPFVGDFLAVILLYYLFSSFYEISPIKTALIVLFIAYLIEWLQYIHFIELMGWGDRKLLKIILGSSFDWGDILAYTLGIGAVLFFHKKNLFSHEKLR